MRLAISHTTRFVYDREVLLGPHLLYLRPRDNPLLQVSDFELELEPAAELAWMRDDFDNLPASARFSSLTAGLEITSRCSVTTSELAPFDFLLRDYARCFPFAYEPLHRFNLGIYLTPPAAPVRAEVDRWLAARFTQRPLDTVAWLFELNRTLFEELRYVRRDAPGMQHATETLRLGGGSCRDYAVTLIDMARSSGLAARFVSGYLYDPHREGRMGGDMHAWVEVFLPGAGWRGLDPTHGVFCDSAYVPVAHAVVAESVNPVQGSFSSPAPATSLLTTDVRVRLVR